jgi:glycosyltransferase involved in cell wall biosynthesis
VKRIVLLSLMPRQHNGGVARWINDFITAFPDRQVDHYSIEDLFSRFGQRQISEWDAAAALGRWLRQKNMVTENDTIIVDGFWGLGIPVGPNVISVCHGTWARRVKEDLDAGIPSEFPEQMKVQYNYWKALVQAGGHIVSVSEFAQDDLRRTWAIESDVINNAIDMKLFSPRPQLYREKPLIIHGVTSKVKATSHIDYISSKLYGRADVMLLDEASQFYKMPKYEALAQANVIVIPSHYEGSSYFTLEALAVDVPVVCYDVGMPWWAAQNGWTDKIGKILHYNHSTYTPDLTYNAVSEVLSARVPYTPRELAALFSQERFRDEWNAYLMKLEK